MPAYFHSIHSLCWLHSIWDDRLLTSVVTYAFKAPFVRSHFVLGVSVVHSALILQGKNIKHKRMKPIVKRYLMYTII